MKNQIIQHFPNYFEGFTPNESEFETLEELVEIPWVKKYLEIYNEDGKNHTFQISENHLMIVRDDNQWWWVVGAIKFPDRVDLPEWVSDSWAQWRKEKKRMDTVDMKKRPLKFRIWNAKDEAFTDDYYALKYGELEWEGVHFLQFTGFNDKNCKEIYEGDIIEIDNVGTKLRREVEFYNGAFHLPRTQGFTIADDWSIMEVIGNIYENPDLL